MYCLTRNDLIRSAATLIYKQVQLSSIEVMMNVSYVRSLSYARGTNFHRYHPGRTVGRTAPIVGFIVLITAPAEAVFG